MSRNFKGVVKEELHIQDGRLEDLFARDYEDVSVHDLGYLQKVIRNIKHRKVMDDGDWKESCIDLSAFGERDIYEIKSGLESVITRKGNIKRKGDEVCVSYPRYYSQDITDEIADLYDDFPESNFSDKLVDFIDKIEDDSRL